MANQGLFSKWAMPRQVAYMEDEKEDQRINKMYMDALRVNPQVAAMLRANERAKRGLRGTVENVASSAFGIQPNLSPALAQAVQREKDLKEILSVLEDYRQSDGKMTADEVQKGWSLLMSKGYQDEAKEFRDMYKTLQDDSNLSYKKKVLTQRQLEFELDKKNIVKSTKEVGDFVDSEGKVFSKYINVYKDGTTGSVLVPLGNDTDKPVGQISPADESGMTSAGRIEESNQIYTRKAILSRQTDKYKENLKRVTAKLQQDLDIGKDKAKMYADWAITSQKET